MASCNIQNPAPGAAILSPFEGDFGRYEESQLKIIRFAELNETDGSIQLASQDFPNAVTAFWFREEQRLDDGFRVKFTISSGGGTSDGFALVIQDDRDEDTVGSAGAALGFEEVFPRYLAVGFDFCSDRPTCTQQRVRIDTKIDNEDSITVADTVQENLFGRPDEGPILLEVQVDYLADQQVVDVFVTNLNEESEEEIDPEDVDPEDDVEEVDEDQVQEEISPILSGGVNLTDILETKFSLIGVTSANSDSFDPVTALDLVVTDFTLEQYVSGFKLVNEAFIQQEVDFGQVVSFSFEIVDTCNQPLENPPILSPNDVSAFIQDNDQVANKVAFNQITQVGALVELIFVTTQEVIATYSLEVEVEGVVVQGSPIDDIIQASRPDPPAVSPVGAVLLGSLSLIVFILIIAATRGFWKYKTKLDEHEEDIEFGKTKETLDQIDSTIEYHMNPLVAPLDRLKERLERNKRFIQEIKEGQKNAEDSDYTVDQLHQENELLRQQIVDVKRQKEFAEAAGHMSMSSDEDFVFIPPPRKEFDEEEFDVPTGDDNASS